MEGDGAQVRILLGALQVDKGLHWLARVGALTNQPDDLLVVEAEVRKLLEGFFSAVAGAGQLPISFQLLEYQMCCGGWLI